MVGALANSFGLGLVLNWQTVGAKEVDQAERKLSKMHRTSNRTAAAVDRDAKRMEKSMQRLKSRMMTGMGMMAVGGGILGGLGLAGKRAADMEQGLADVNTLLVATGYNSQQAAQAQAQLKGAIMSTASGVRTPLSELTKSTYDLISADLSVAEAQGAIGYTAKLGVAAMGTMQEATETMTSDLNTYGKIWAIA